MGCAEPLPRPLSSSDEPDKHSPACIVRLRRAVAQRFRRARRRLRRVLLVGRRQRHEMAIDWLAVTGTSELRLNCGGVAGNSLPITFNLIPKP